MNGIISRIAVFIDIQHTYTIWIKLRLFYHYPSIKVIDKRFPYVKHITLIIKTHIPAIRYNAFLQIFCFRCSGRPSRKQAGESPNCFLNARLKTSGYSNPKSKAISMFFASENSSLLQMFFPRHRWGIFMLTFISS